MTSLLDYVKGSMLDHAQEWINTGFLGRALLLIRHEYNTDGTARRLDVLPLPFHTLITQPLTVVFLRKEIPGVSWSVWARETPDDAFLSEVCV